jgi:YggT family protein
MLSGALVFLIETAFGLFVVALLLRFYMQWVRAPYRNPLAEFLRALTDFMVVPARRVVPGLFGLDLATFALAWLIQLAEIFIVMQLRGFEPAAGAGSAFAWLVLLALVVLAKVALFVLLVIVVVQVALSWLQPEGRWMPLLNSLTRPMLRPFQRRIPPVGNVDLSPLFALVVIQLLLMLPVAWAEMTIQRLL